ncbi:VCBS repeat-containing protein [Streptomyces sp. P9(2023)]|uniref:FG-GAP repeat domain-containing protein n=1 Tax=Streptomyces sp. P9(2023) TaxID=3064394 RepID=UPI0028F3F6AA|nr:VCBS repeat-containing protein [Streptomyces sp. P9(2023)]MDT9691775.1 VCBS repeat-containing protein [Streptomyces sp. P9(2023)]
MPHSRSTRRRLLAAATTVLAVTLGAGALTVPASAATVADGEATADAANTAATPIPFPKDARLMGAGLTGFLSRSDGTSDQRWTRYADGSSRVYGWSTYLRSSRTTDYLVLDEQRKITLRNLSTLSVLEVRVADATGAEYAGSAANAVFTRSTTDGTTLRMHRHATEGGAVDVTGLPAGATAVSVAPGTPEDALVTFTDGTVKKWGLLDLATGAVDEIRNRTAGSVKGDVAVSETHVAWTDGDDLDMPAIFVLDRATGTVQQIPVEDGYASGLQIGLVGGWVVYGEPGGISSIRTSPLHALTAYDPATKAKVKLLDHLTSSVAAPDGLYVRGGTVAQGEGLYKIAPGEAGAAPVVTLVATTGEPTHVVIGTNDIPATVDLDKNGGRASLTWQVSRTSVEATITLRHVRTGQTREFGRSHPYTPSVTVDWDGRIGPGFISAYNGDYTWEVTARPLNGIGPATSASGTFKVVRKTVPHDFDDNGSADVLNRDASGRLWRTDTIFYKEFGQLTDTSRQLIGSGWNIYDRIEATGNLGGSAVGDLVARDKAGVLWLYQGNGRGGFATRTKVGAGWQTYDKIAAGSDLNGDGRPDLLATDKAGTLWLHKGTGSATAPFAARTKIGGGWGIYNDLTAVGDIAGGTAGDLLARDKTGVLWLYTGKGDGTFAARTKVGSGWGTYQQLVGIGDGDRDGRPDLLAFHQSGAAYLYGGTGNWRTPLRGKQLASLPYVGGAGNHVL